MLTCLLEGVKICSTHYTPQQLKDFSVKDMLICEECGQPYEYCNGLIRTPYFRHKNKSNCSNYGEPETDEHLTGKLHLYEWIKSQQGVTDVELEYYIPITKQRPDIKFIYKNQTYVIEYQCTPIASEYHIRHQHYEALGIKDVWITGTQKYKKYGGNTVQRASGYSYDIQGKITYSGYDFALSDTLFIGYITTPKYHNNIAPKHICKNLLEKYSNLKDGYSWSVKIKDTNRYFSIVDGKFRYYYYFYNKRDKYIATKTPPVVSEENFKIFIEYFEVLNEQEHNITEIHI